MIGAEREHKVAVWSTSHTVPERNQATIGAIILGKPPYI
jgi:hypothetical protein